WSCSFAPKKGVSTARLLQATFNIGNRIDVPFLMSPSCTGKSPVLGSLGEPTRNNNLPLYCKPISQPS
ncbi:MAG: hypothetical protein ACXWFC_09305, partial [Nitrososphaeraceae archaeon]